MSSDYKQLLSQLRQDCLNGESHNRKASTITRHEETRKISKPLERLEQPVSVHQWPRTLLPLNCPSTGAGGKCNLRYIGNQCSADMNKYYRYIQTVESIVKTMPRIFTHSQLNNLKLLKVAPSGNSQLLRSLIRMFPAKFYQNGNLLQKQVWISLCNADFDILFQSLRSHSWFDFINPL